MLLKRLVFLFLPFGLLAQNKYPLVPLPARLVGAEGTFICRTGQKVAFVGDAASKSVTQNFISQLNTASGLGWGLLGKGTSNVTFTLVKNTSLDEEGYRLSIKPDRISVEAETPRGFFYAVQTLYQLLPPAVLNTAKTEGTTWAIPCCDITDSPRFGYRGMMLDVSRHFFPVAFVKKYIDLLAHHKMNYMHWHLTDDQGWRIEIKKYPKLTQLASKREQTLQGHYSENFPQKFDGTPHGGFYTQAEIRDIVSYANSRFVTIIPEIEMPGHAVAALSAYPELGCEPTKAIKVGQIWGVYDDVFCPNDKTFKFLEDVLTEVFGLFPSKYIHIGGDECPKTAWKKSAFCQDLMKKQGLKDEHELQSFFVKRMEKFINSRGRQMIGWDEILEGGLSPNATVMSWRGTSGGIEAAKQNHDVIMTPGEFCYIDHYQADPAVEPLSIGGYLPIEKVYSYDPMPAELPENQQKRILGLQGNLWTEYIKTPAAAEYMAYPRGAAIAEVGWSPKGAKNFEDFADRLETHLKVLDILKVNYSKAMFDVRASALTNEQGLLQVRLNTANSFAKTFFTTDGKEPNDKSAEYEKPINIQKVSATIKAVSPSGRVATQAVVINKATGKKYRVTSAEISATEEGKLTNGILATSPQSEDKFLMFYGGKDLEMTLDLGDVMPVSKVSAQYIKKVLYNYLPPTQIEVSVAKDEAKEFKEVATQPTNASVEGPWGVGKVEAQFKSVRCRYLKIKIKNAGICPDNHPNKGQTTAMGIDEIVVE